MESAYSRGIYRHACPVCGGPNSELRLRRGLPCPRCLPPGLDEKASGEDREAVARVLQKAGAPLGKYSEILELDREARGLIEFFSKAVYSRPWGAQRTWARRLARRDSFSIIAPTGVGKTTFGLAAALYFACAKSEKSYIILPTTTLVMQAYKKISSMMENSGCRARVLAVHSKLSRKARLEALDAIEKGDFDVLITTIAFARSKLDLVARHRYRLVFVDDVDAAIKSGRSVDVVLRVTGFTEDDIEAGMKLLRLQMELARLQAILIRRRERGRQGKRQQTGGGEERLRGEIERIMSEIERLKARIESARARAASLIVSSATGRPRGQRVRLFRVLLNFEAGGRGDLGLRNVVDSYTELGELAGETGEASLQEAVASRVAELVSTLGTGGLVFVPLDWGVEYAEKLAYILQEKTGLRVDAYHSKKPAYILEAYEKGEIDVLVGVANYYGALVRGLDLPERVRYTVFAGVPRHKFSARVEDPHPARLLRLLGILAEIKVEDVAEKARKHLAGLRKLVRRLSPAALQAVAERVAKGEVRSERDPAWVVTAAFNYIREALSRDDVWEALADHDVTIIRDEQGGRYLLVPDPATYIQASGRTSRLYAGGITKGLSVVVVDYPGVFRGLMRRVKWMVETEWKRIEELDLDSLLREIDEDRERVKRVRQGRGEAPELVKTALLIVESPNKARTIARFFGQPSIRILPGGLRAYEVALGDLILTIAASGGHVYDLVKYSDERDADTLKGEAEYKKEFDVLGIIRAWRGGQRDFIPVYTSLKRCIVCGYQFVDEGAKRCPVCGSTLIRDSRDIVEDLRRLAWEVDLVLVGTDPDTEGEKIGWDVSLLIMPYNPKVERLEFHEVTKKAILKALTERRGFNHRLIDAQIVRRIEDRWIGFTLSPLLWCDFWPNVYCRLLAEKLGFRGDGRARSVDEVIGNVKVKFYVGTDYSRCPQARRGDGGYGQGDVTLYMNLSAGRVQTPTLGWIVKRTIENAEKVEGIRLVMLSGGKPVFRVFLREDEHPEISKVLLEIKRYAVKEKKNIKSLEDMELTFIIGPGAWSSQAPPPPYTTDTMLADASRYLGMSAPEAMRLAQDLFEWGLITYHRTDSTRVSDKGIQVAAEWLQQAFGDAWRSLFSPRRWGEGGAHEAIRPTRPIDAQRLQILVEEGSIEVAGELTWRHLRLYDLIFRRFIASQMRPTEVLKADIAVRFDLLGGVEVTLGERILRIGRGGGDPDETRGFAIIWPYLQPEAPSEWAEIALMGGGAVKSPATIQLESVSKKPLMTHGEVISLMKERGIGRPSTYAKIVDTLLRRYYVMEVGGARRSLMATYRGYMVHLYLSKEIRRLAGERAKGRVREALMRVPDLVSEERTRQLEREMLDIEEGRRGRVEVLNEIYDEISGLVELVTAIPFNSWEGGKPVRGLRAGGSSWEAQFSRCVSKARRETPGGQGATTAEVESYWGEERSR